MNFRSLGKTGFRVSELAFGTWLNIGQRLDDSASSKLISMAYDKGVNLFDTAENYGWGEAQLALGRIIHNSNWPRDSYYISSKAFYGSRQHEIPMQRGLSRKHLLDSCNDALRRLRLDYLDLYLCHAYDPGVSIEDIVWTMHILIMQGKIMHWGTSKWTASQIQCARSFALENHLIGPSLEQPEYNLLTKKTVEGGLVNLVETCGFGLISWSPLKQGILAGRYCDGIKIGSRFSFSDFKTLKDSVSWPQYSMWIDFANWLGGYSRELGVSQAQLAIAWCLKNRMISSVLLGCSNKVQLDECLGASAVAARITPEMWLEMHDLGGDYDAT